MNYHGYKQSHRQHCKPIATQREGWKGWALAVIMGLAFAAAIAQWGLS